MEIGNKKYVENMHKIYILYRKIYREAWNIFESCASIYTIN
jgi:hypothetical protein